MISDKPIMIRSGIDEAGYGPLLGPLTVVRCTAQDDPRLQHLLTECGVKDSKKVHKPGSLAGLETIALAGITWLTGYTPTTMSDVFALLGEAPEDREGLPWMEGAELQSVPIAANNIPDWSHLPSVNVHSALAGAIIHPCEINEAAQTGRNKATLELEHVGQLLSFWQGNENAISIVDRLGGRRYYSEHLSSLWPTGTITIIDESKGTSRYSCTLNDQVHAIDFLVKADANHALTALASCIAKYTRELHMKLFNDWWSTQIRGLKPTAGYPQDAKRWIFQIGEGFSGAWKEDLVRGSLKQQSN